MRKIVQVAEIIQCASKHNKMKNGSTIGVISGVNENERAGEGDCVLM